MPLADPRETLLGYLGRARGSLIWKVEGLSEYDARRPLTATGTNLLGLVKHLASVELGYFGETFGRPSGIALPWYDDPDGDPNADLYLTADETRAEILDLYRAAIAHADRTCAELPLDAVGRVPWWPDGSDEVTLHQVLVHMIAETCRHAGHADILREGLDQRTGRFAVDPNLDDSYDWPAHVARVEQNARRAAE